MSGTADVEQIELCNISTLMTPPNICHRGSSFLTISKLGVFSQIADVLARLLFTTATPAQWFSFFMIISEFLSQYHFGLFGQSEMMVLDLTETSHQ